MLNTGTKTPEITRKAQEGIDRFGEVLAEYRRMKGVEGDVLTLGNRDLYTGVLADGFLWCLVSGIEPLAVIAEAHRLAVEENLPSD